MNKIEKYGVGTIHENRHCEKFEIIGKCDRPNYRLIRFIDPHKYITEVNIAHIKEKQINNTYRKSICGVGYFGEGKDFFGKKYDTQHPLYSVWSNMLNRCYNLKNMKYHLYGGNNVTVCNEWHNFSYFVDDILEMHNGSLLYESKIIKDYKGIKYALDKDSTNSKVYSRDTVKIIPMTINSGMSRIKDEDRKSKIMQDILDSEKATNWVCKMDEGMFL